MWTIKVWLRNVQLNDSCQARKMFVNGLNLLIWKFTLAHKRMEKQIDKHDIDNWHRPLGGGHSATTWYEEQFQLITIIRNYFSFFTCPAIVKRKTSRTRNGNAALYDLWDQRRCAPEVRVEFIDYDLNSSKFQLANLLLFRCLKRKPEPRLEKRTEKIDKASDLKDCTMTNLHQTYV